MDNPICCVSPRESSNKENDSSQSGWFFTTVRKKKDPNNVSNGTVSWPEWEDKEVNVITMLVV